MRQRSIDWQLKVRSRKEKKAPVTRQGLGLWPGESWHRPDIILPAYIEENLTPHQSANRLAEFFSQTVEPLNEILLPPVVREALKDGRSSRTKPVLTQHQVYCKMLRVTKPWSSVEGDVPKVLLNKYTFQYAQPAMMIFNKIIGASYWPRQWVHEHVVV